SQSVSQSDVIFSENDNLIIKGNNLIALASLLKRYEGKVKCIYIDPPYNTGNDSFGYNDRFNHSTWLVFMKNRLELAKKLLSDDGVITVQCDDREQAYLKVLMDGIFGRENFLNCVAVKMSENTGVKMNHAKNRFPKLKEYILIYTKPSFKEFIEIDKYKEEEWDSENNIFIENLTREQRNLLVKLEMKERNNEEDVVIGNNILKFAKKVPLSDKIKSFNFKNEEEKKEWLFKNSYRIIKTAGSSSLIKVVKKIKEIPKQDLAAAVSKKGVLFFYITDFNRETKEPRLRVIFADSNIFKNPCDFWQDIKTSGAISDEGGIKFVNSKKPEKILYRLIKMITKPNDLILDFFLGSGTTAAVAHKMGRRYIGIEQMDYIEDIAVERLKKVIDGEQTGISKTVNWQGGGSFVYCELKENGQELINIILSSNEKSIDKIKEKIFSDDRIVPYITKQELEKVDKDFLNLKLEEKKKVLMDLVDKNKLYINYSDIDNEEYDISKEEKQFNNSFYKDVK
ncbi:MAG: site-specific DNA-methyltransferase, partial [Leptotrichia wadei]